MRVIIIVVVLLSFVLDVESLKVFDVFLHGGIESDYEIAQSIHKGLCN